MAKTRKPNRSTCSNRPSAYRPNTVEVPTYSEFEALNRLWKMGIDTPTGEDLAEAYLEIMDGFHSPNSFYDEQQNPDRYD
jgi:hypothetical protein